MEYRIVTDRLGQTTPSGSTRIGYKGGVVWIGDNASTALAGYDSVIMTPEEIIEFEAPNFSTEEMVGSIKRILMILASSVIANGDCTQKEIDDLAVVFNYWNPTRAYKAGKMFRYGTKLYRTKVAITPDVTKLPDSQPTLYELVTK